MRFRAISFRFLLALFASLPLEVSAATYTFVGNSRPPCSTNWSVSGNTYTCTGNGSITLAAGDTIAPPAAITVVAANGWTLNGNNTVGSPAAPVNIESGYGAITIHGNSTIHGNVTSSASGQTLTITNTAVHGSVTTTGRIELSGANVSGNVQATSQITTYNGTIVGGNVYSLNNSVTLNGGHIYGSVYSGGGTGITSNNATVDGGLLSTGNTVRINGGSISGGVYAGGGQGIIIENANVSGGLESAHNSIRITNSSVSGGMYAGSGGGIFITGSEVISGPTTLDPAGMFPPNTTSNITLNLDPSKIEMVGNRIEIDSSTIGTPSQPMTVQTNNAVEITNGSIVYGIVIANRITIIDSVVTIDCIPKPKNAPPGVCQGNGGGNTVNHFEIHLPAETTFLTCETVPVQVRACTTGSAPCPSNELATFETEITLTASAGTGAGYRKFTGSTTYTLSLANALSPGETGKAVSLGIANATAQCFSQGSAAACGFSVRKSKFDFQVPNFHAGDGAGNVQIKAVSAAENDPRKCASFVPQGGVTMSMEYVNPALNPAARPLLLTYKGASYNLSTPKDVGLEFDANGATTFGVNYHDAGRVKLKAAWNDTEGESSFVVKPYFVITDLVCADGTPNPGATGPGGAKFCRAGQPFRATVHAVTSDRSTPTPNFGREAPQPASVILRATQVSPATVPVPPGVLMGGANLVKNGNAQSVASSLIWTEVGVIALTPGIAGGDYLGAGDIEQDAVAHVGRFYPHHFETQVVPPMECPDSGGTPAKGFAYAGQPFQLKVSARNANGDITRNYAGGTGYAKAGTLSALTADGAAPAGESSGALNAAALTAARFVNGEAELEARYAFSTPPGTPTDIYLRAGENGGDGVTSNGSAEGGIRIAQGRIRLSNVFGRANASLEMPIEAQMWSGTSWVRNTADNTALSPASVISQPALSGTITLSPLAQGQGKIHLPATASGVYTIGVHLGEPAAPFTSCVQGMTGGAPANAPWLRSRYGSCPALTDPWSADPTARASFGIFALTPETRKMIHVRERY